VESQALYRRWRPQTFSEVIGQEHVTRTLQNALRDGRVAHAYLFTGPRGTGKTSVARILAKAVNCLAEDGVKPCNRCSICQSITEGRSLDLIEIDAASNTGVDDVRDLREKVGFSPTECRYKVYIIDEVHMLSTAAFNALLKTLEEPPPHVIFVLATTEVHKVLPTILSRCQRFDFHRLSLKDLVGKLSRICQAEGIETKPGVLELIARSATGSFRDAESILDQLVAFTGGTITLEDVQALLGTVAESAVQELVDHVIAGDLKAGLHLINAVVDEGADPRQFTRQLLEYLRGLLLLQANNEALLNVSDATLARMRSQVNGLPPDRLIAVMRRFNDALVAMRPGWQSQLPLEMALVEVVLSYRGVEGEGDREVGRDRARMQSAPEKPGASRMSAGAPEMAPATSAQAHTPPATFEPVKVPPEAPQTADREATAIELKVVESRWPDVLQAVRAQNRSVEALLKDCQPVAVEEDVVTLRFFYPFHKQRIEDPRSKAVVESALTRVLGGIRRIRCVLMEKGAEPAGGDSAHPPSTPESLTQKPHAHPLARPPEQGEHADRADSSGQPAPKTITDLVADDPLIRVAVEEFGARIADVRTEA